MKSVSFEKSYDIWFEKVARVFIGLDKISGV